MRGLVTLPCRNRQSDSPNTKPAGFGFDSLSVRGSVDQSTWSTEFQDRDQLVHLAVTVFVAIMTYYRIIYIMGNNIMFFQDPWNLAQIRRPDTIV